MRWLSKAIVCERGTLRNRLSGLIILLLQANDSTWNNQRPVAIEN
jgi:hypothetical protein